MLLPVLLLSLTNSVQDWPELRGPDQDGAARDVPALSEPFALRSAWNRALGSGYSGLVVAGGLVVGSFSDGTDDSVVALDVENGEERWRFRLGAAYPGQQGAEDGPTSTPCIAGGRIFAPGPRGKLFALDLNSGEELWSVDLVKEFGASFRIYGFGASPISLGDSIYLPVGTRRGLAGVAFDPRTGDVRWTHRGAWLDYQNSLRFHEEGLMLAADAARLALLDVESGETLMSFDHAPRGTDMAYPQIVPVDEGRYLFAYERELVLRRLDPVKEKLESLWHSRALKHCYSPPVVHDGAIYGLSGTFLVCADLETGRAIWKSREPSARGLVLVGDQLVMLSSEGDLVLAEATREGYSESARTKVADRGGYTPACFGAGRLFARNTSGLTCVEIIPVQEGAIAVSNSADSPLPNSLAELVDADSIAPAKLDTWWGAHDSPLVEGERVHFMYRGAADDVAILGDMTRDRSAPHTMRRVADTDLFHRSYPLEPRGLWQYTYLLDLERPVRDPRNPRTAPALSAIHGNPDSLGYEPLATESLWHMPDWERPAFLDGLESAGGRVQSLRYESRILRATRELSVYLPEVFDEADFLPVVYVTGGDYWFEHGELAPALDALMRDTCAPAVVVGLPFHVGSRDQMGGDDYARAILEEVAPLIRKEFGTGAVELAFGAADDAAGVLALAALAPKRFKRLAVFSPAADPEEFRLLERAEATPEAIYVEWSAYESRLADQNTDYAAAARRLFTHFSERGCEVAGGEVRSGPGFASWSTRLDRVLTLLLPRE